MDLDIFQKKKKNYWANSGFIIARYFIRLYWLQIVLTNSVAKCYTQQMEAGFFFFVFKLLLNI
jgi:hypothetical protein